ncbi:MAG: hypothetical protein GY953_36135, partial [bacterium]|nr:hypothetical protein [bacterium]
MRLRIAKLVIPLGLLPLGVWAVRTGPPPAHTGAPGENTCFTGGCHQTPTGDFVPDSAGIAIAFPSGNTYVPGVAQRLQLAVTDAQGDTFGFQLSVRDQGNGQAGDLAPADTGTDVELASGIQYLAHSIEGPRTNGTFEFDWTPPATDAGPVTFYVAANAANNDGGRGGDRIHARSFELQPAAARPMPTISDGGVVHGATFTTDQGYAPNTFGTIVGTDLVQSTQVWDNFFTGNVAPTQLGGAKVLVNGTPAFISFTGTAEDLQR